MCQIIVDELDSPTLEVKPKEANPSFGVWVAAAVRVLKLGDVRNAAFQRLISQHHRLTTTLGDLRNDAGPVSHGKDGFIEKLSAYHRRAAVLSADAIVAFLHQGYRETELNLLRTREPYERFPVQNELIDKWCTYTVAEIDDGGLRGVRKHGKNIRASRTKAMIDRWEEKEAARRTVSNMDMSNGLELLAEYGRLDCSYEQIILDFPHEFDEILLSKARANLGRLQPRPERGLSV